MDKRLYHKIVEFCESHLDRHADGYRAVGWTSLEATLARYQVMLEIVQKRGPVDVLDFGCGTGGFIDFLADKGQCHDIRYTGLDISERYVAICRKKYPHLPFIHTDVFFNEIPGFDYILMNGIFTAKTLALTYTEMWNYLTSLVRKVFAHTKAALAFNVMTKAVDWEKDYLFHVPVGAMTDFVTTLTRRYAIRHDYGCYEYTVYMYK